jgi:DNA-binding GntR family transcriptional regulator
LQQPEHKTKSEIALQELRLALVRGELAEDRRLTVIELQEALGMSSTPIREAIRILETEGLLHNEPHRGIRVRSLTLEEVAELYLLRAPLERIAGQLAAEAVSDYQLSELAKIQSKFEHAAAGTDDASMTRVNADFHYAIYRATNTRYLEKTISRLWVPYFWGANWSLTGRSESVEEHAAILGALTVHDGEGTGDLLERHTMRVYNNIRRELERRDELEGPSDPADSVAICEPA